MKCDEIRERMPDVAAGFNELTAEDSNHLAGCNACAETLKAMSATMSLLDEWKVAEPSPYFDVRLQARLREEIAKPQASWLHWFRRPVMSAALTVVLGVGMGLFIVGRPTPTPVAAVDQGPGSAVSDLSTLEKNHDLYANFELLDDLDLQQDVTATSQNAD